MPTAPAPGSASAWLHDVEQQSLARLHDDEGAAAARFDALPVGRRIALAREIAVTRAGELTLAYRNVVTLAAGFRARRSATGTPELHPEPCVIFVVKRKWSSAQPASAQRLPTRLIVCAPDAEGRPQRYAVPTDVQPARWSMGARARSTACVQMLHAQALLDTALPGTLPAPLPGTLTCAVTAQGDSPPKGPLAMSAMHVLSPGAPQNTVTGGVTFEDAEPVPGKNAAVRGVASVWGGRLNGDTGQALDLQLADGVDEGWLHSAYAGTVLNEERPWMTKEELDAHIDHRQFTILVPDNNPIDPTRPRRALQAQYTAHVFEHPIDYLLVRKKMAQRVLLRHRELLVLQVAEHLPPPLDGDSGSPVLVAWFDGSLALAGMFIASPDPGQGDPRRVFVLPAWRLFDLDDWSHPPPGTTALIPSLGRG